MNCNLPGAAGTTRPAAEVIGEFVDGTLDAGTRASCEAHLAGCATCRALAADFAALRVLARGLEPLTPPPHVWTKLAAAIEERPRRAWPLGSGWFSWQPLAAAAMTLLVGVALWSLGAGLSPAGSATRAPAATAPRSTDALPPAADMAAEAEYTAAIAGLEQIHLAEAQALDPDTADVVQANLTVLDEAIGESRAALETQPDNEVVLESLYVALRTKVALLQDTIALINEMRQGNQEAAARIVSGLNQ